MGIAPFPVKTWTDLLEDLQDPDRSGGAGEEDEEEVENTPLNNAAEAAAMLIHTESVKRGPEVSVNRASIWLAFKNKKVLCLYFY